ncbi:hypothetical protein Slin15195_G104620 [Septoria linicola]|uniref:Uncharacterized protein n=1 Tax=Septoria linicola TaxID=215465 RepID=A0A9Q9B1F0_9PEZI|nr:hypothetical protein Slin14017_G067660 [Septoria linicola]USW57143.1 hypothetical protein Slin15195_G104620 [Septoria linicola]
MHKPDVKYKPVQGAVHWSRQEAKFVIAAPVPEYVVVAPQCAALQVIWNALPLTVTMASLAAGQAVGPGFTGLLDADCPAILLVLVVAAAEEEVESRSGRDAIGGGGEMITCEADTLTPADTDMASDADVDGESPAGIEAVTESTLCRVDSFDKVETKAADGSDTVGNKVGDAAAKDEATFGVPDALSLTEADRANEAETASEGLPGAAAAPETALCPRLVLAAGGKEIAGRLGRDGDKVATGRLNELSARSPDTLAAAEVESSKDAETAGERSPDTASNGDGTFSGSDVLTSAAVSEVTEASGRIDDNSTVDKVNEAVVCSSKRVSASAGEAFVDNDTAGKSVATAEIEGVRTTGGPETLASAEIENANDADTWNEGPDIDASILLSDCAVLETSTRFKAGDSAT